MGMKLFYRAALLDFANVVGPNGSNSNSETTRFVEVVTLKKFFPPFYRCFFPAWHLS